MAVTYHSVIGMVKLAGSFFRSFIGTFLKNILTGAGIMLIWFLLKLHWLQANVKINRII